MDSSQRVQTRAYRTTTPDPAPIKRFLDSCDTSEIAAVKLIQAIGAPSAATARFC